MLILSGAGHFKMTVTLQNVNLYGKRPNVEQRPCASPCVSVIEAAIHVHGGPRSIVSYAFERIVFHRSLVSSAKRLPNNIDQRRRLFRYAANDGFAIGMRAANRKLCRIASRS